MPMEREGRRRHLDTTSYDVIELFRFGYAEEIYTLYTEKLCIREDNQGCEKE